MTSNSSQKGARKFPFAVLLIAAGVGLLALAGYFLLTSQANPSASARPLPGARLADFSLRDTTGKTVKLSDYAGKPVLINIWATWCPPCRDEMPLLNSYYKQYRGNGFSILAINSGESPAQAAEFARQAELAFPVLSDPDQRVSDRLGAHSLPLSILVGRDGLVKAIRYGNYTRQTFESEVLPHIGN